MKYSIVKKSLWLVVLYSLIFLPMVGCARAADPDWQKKFTEIRWVDYSPSAWNPDKGIEPSTESIKEDLAALRKAKFTGLVTYGSRGRLGSELPSLAKEAGFEGMILGVWNPGDSAEVASAKQAAMSEVVLGICVGNEGLMEHRYVLETLAGAMKDIRQATKKPVTTTEIIQNYEQLLDLVDWAFPNAHPYFANITDPDSAVIWTHDAFQQLKRKTNLLVMLKEEGLPTAGDAKQPLSELAQCEYYDSLAKTDSRFAYFEAFDQVWKTTLPIEPHWGVYRQDRSPKLLARHLSEGAPCKALTAAHNEPEPADVGAFYVYRDKDDSRNRFVGPKDLMGDVGDISIVEDWRDNPYSGETSVKFHYSAQGNGPTCNYKGPCGWAGVYWLQPPGNWGTNPNWTNAGHDLTGYKKLRFWARADTPAEIEFKVGGVIGPNDRDTLRPARSHTAHLSGTWNEFTIDLEGADLKNVIGGFAWVATREKNPHGVTFYVDEIRFTKN
jgi:exo-beta-1,3-glucanase (GH17 family)